MLKLYSNNCPRCNILKKKLDDAKIEYELSTDFQEVINEGFRTAPVLKRVDEFGDQWFLDFDQAMKYIIQGGK